MKGNMGGDDFREGAYEKSDLPGKTWLTEFLHQRGAKARIIPEAYKKGDVLFLMPDGRKETADAEVRDKDYIWTIRETDGHPVFYHPTYSVLARRQDSEAILQASFAKDGLSVYFALTADIGKGEFWLDFTDRGESPKYNLKAKWILVFHRKSMQELWKLCDGPCWKSRVCEEDVPNPSLDVLCQILRYPLEML